MFFRTCQANTASDDSRKCAEDIDSGIQPLGHFVIGTRRLVKPGNLLVKKFEDGVWGIAVLEFSE